MCSPWKKIFTLAPLAPLIMFSPIFKLGVVGKHGKKDVRRYWKGPNFFFLKQGVPSWVLKMLIF
jgi:hypothetical protein